MNPESRDREEGGGRRRGQQRNKDHLRKNRAPERQYLFDAAFGADSTQEEVYLRTTKPLVEAVLDGYNACVFAYGATGGGKTYTMVRYRFFFFFPIIRLFALFPALDVAVAVDGVASVFHESFEGNSRKLSPVRSYVFSLLSPFRSAPRTTPAAWSAR